LLATTNPGKAKEMEAYLKDLPVRIYSLQDFRLGLQYQESGKTFMDNARGKSIYYSKRWEGLTLGEDSGLEIDFLNGAPGVISARYSGPKANDANNIAKVLRLMLGVPEENRRARFVSTMVLSQKGNIIKEIRETVRGYVSTQAKGEFGFGYDPIFFYPPLEKTMAELPPEEKNQVSHRGKALKKLRKFLEEYLKKSS
jgi:XTP/dITP diphosphohydrolase